MQEERYIPNLQKEVKHLSTCGIKNLHTQPKHLKPTSLVLQLIEHCVDNSVILSDGIVESRFLVREKIREKTSALAKYDIVKCGVIYFLSANTSTGSDSPTKEAFLILSSVEQIYTGVKSKLGRPTSYESTGFKPGDKFGDVVIMGPDRADPVPIPLEITSSKIEDWKTSNTAVSTQLSSDRPNPPLKSIIAAPANNLKLQDTSYFTRINQLSLNSRSWALKVRVTFKSKKIEHAKCKLFKVIIADSSGILELVFYNDFCDKYFGTVQVGHVFILTAARIKPASQYNLTAMPIEIEFDNKTELADCSKSTSVGWSDNMPPEFSPYLESLKLATTNKHSTKDLLTVVGLVVFVGHKEELTLKEGRREHKQTFQILDEENCKVDINCWGNNLVGQDKINVGDIVVFEHFKKAIFKEGVSFSNSMASRVIFDREDYITAKLFMLRKLRNSLKLSEFKILPANLEDLTHKQQQQTKLTSVADLITCSQEYLQKETSLMQSDRPASESFYKTVVCQVKEFGTKFWYESCGRNKCLNTIKDMGGYFECPKCGIVTESNYKPTPRYMTSIVIADETNTARVFIFSDEVGRAVLGLSVEELVDLKRVSDELSATTVPDALPMNIHLRKRTDVFFKLTITAKIEEYNSKKYSKLCIIRAVDLSMNPNAVTPEIEETTNRIIQKKTESELGKRGSPADDLADGPKEPTQTMLTETNQKLSVYEMLNSPAKRLKTE